MSLESAMAVLDKSATPPPAESATPSPAPTPTPGAAVPAEPAQAATSTPEKPPEKPEDSAASRFAVAARQERKLQVERAALKAERERIEADRKALDAQRLRPKEYLKSPIQALRDAFPDMDPSAAYRLLSESILQDGKAPPEAAAVAVQRDVQAVREEIEKLKEERKRAEERAAQAETTRALTEYKSGLREKIKAAGEKYELTDLYGDQGVDLVFETQAKWYQDNDGEELPFDEAAKKVEDYLESQVLEKALKSKKMQAKLKPQAPPASPSLGQAGNPSPPQAGARRSEAERVAAAMRAVRD
jgi:hypothetical protein